MRGELLSYPRVHDVVGANDQYIGLCRKHWMLGDLGPDFNGQGTGD